MEQVLKIVTKRNYLRIIEERLQFLFCKSRNQLNRVELIKTSMTDLAKKEGGRERILVHRTLMWRRIFYV